MRKLTNGAKSQDNLRIGIKHEDTKARSHFFSLRTLQFFAPLRESRFPDLLWTADCLLNTTICACLRRLCSKQIHCYSSKLSLFSGEGLGSGL